ncbi:hypothetical protein FKM82_018170 [Ascaphus truei]
MEEVAAKKRKKKKKKNKPSPNSDHRDAEKCQNKNIIVQEPPKFQDDEEFPDLASSVGSSERGPRLGTIKSYSYSQVSRHAVEAAKTKGGGRKSKAPVQLDLGGMLAALEQKQHTEKTKQSTKPVVLSVGSGVPMLTREPVTVTKHQQSKQEKAPHNPLDSSAPLVKKGKQREVPKAKKPTSLKKAGLIVRETDDVVVVVVVVVASESCISLSDDVVGDQVFDWFRGCHVVTASEKSNLTGFKKSRRSVASRLL